MLKCFDLTGKTALVTGAGGALGGVFARALSEAGANLFLVDCFEDALIHLAEELSATGKKNGYSVCNILDEQSIQNAVDKCVSDLGTVDILVNAAGCNRVNLSPMDTDTAAYNHVVQTNMIGTLNMSKACARDMMKRSWGRIVNIASISGIVVNKGVYGGSYEVTKAAMIMMTKTLATEWCTQGICVNSIAPGYFGTKSNKDFFAADDTFYDKVMAMIPINRMGDPEELVGSLILLCSDAASYIQGECIVVDGGYTCW